MQSIGIIPEAGSLAGSPSAKGAGGTAADGFLALLAALNGGAGLLLPADLRNEQEKAQGQALTGQAPAAGQTQTTQLHGESQTADSNANLVVAAANTPQTPAAPRPTLTAETPVRTAAQPAGPQTAAPDSQTPIPNAAPLGPAPDEALPAGTPSQPQTASSATTPTPLGAAGTARPESPTTSTAAPPIPVSQPDQAAKADTSAARAAAIQPNADAQTSPAASKADAPPPAEARPEPQLAAQARVAAQAQAETPTQAQIVNASIVAGSLATRGTTAQKSEGQAAASRPPVDGGAKVPAGEAVAAPGERTLIASSRPAKPTVTGKAAKQAQATTVAEQTVQQGATTGLTAEQSASQVAQQNSRPPLWTAALASLQTLQNADPEIFGQGMGAIDSGVEPLTSPSQGANPKAGSEGYSQTASRLASMPPSDQLALQIQRAVTAQVQRFSIRLEPAELGRIDVRLDFARDGKVQAAITVERPETFDLMQRDIQSLERSLKESGGQNAGFELNLQLGSNGGEQRETAGEQSLERDWSEPAADELPSLPDLPAIAYRGPMTGLIDIRA